MLRSTSIVVWLRVYSETFMRARSSTARRSPCCSPRRSNCRLPQAKRQTRAARGHTSTRHRQDVPWSRTAQVRGAGGGVHPGSVEQHFVGSPTSCRRRKREVTYQRRYAARRRLFRSSACVPKTSEWLGVVLDAAGTSPPANLSQKSAGRGPPRDAAASRRAC